MTDKQLFKLALDALEDFGNHDNACPQWPTYSEPEKYPKCNCGYDDAITALKERLAQPEQEPKIGCVNHDCDQCKAQRTEQEPVCPDCKAKVLYECVACSSNNYPPQRKPLTDEEIFALENSIPDEVVSDRDWCIHFARAIEAKLKENT
jgi:hypothetical protein